MAIATLQPIPFVIISFYLCKKPQLPDSVKILWIIGLMFGVFDSGLGFMIAFPKFFETYWGIVVVWITLTLNGVEHWLFALEYYYSSLSISNKLNLKSVFSKVPTYKTKVFLSVTVAYALF